LEFGTCVQIQEQNDSSLPLQTLGAMLSDLQERYRVRTIFSAYIQADVSQMIAGQYCPCQQKSY